jgi:hypothetical protein
MLVTHTRTPLSGDRISVHQVTSNLTEATRTKHVTRHQKVVTRNITTKTGPKNQERGGGGKKKQNSRTGPLCATRRLCGERELQRSPSISHERTLAERTLHMTAKATFE